LNIAGQRIGPSMKSDPIRLFQTGPGIYEAEVDAREVGNHIVQMTYSGAGNQRGFIMGGFSQTTSPETRDLQSNDALLREIAERTGGRVISPFDGAVNLFSRDNIPTASSPLPVWDVLVPFLLALMIVDVAVRRIAWDWLSTKRAAAAAAAWVKSFTTVRKVDKAEETLGALKQVRAGVAEQKFKVGESATTPASAEASARPDPKAKFVAREGVSGDITSVVGGATNKAVPPPPKTKVTPKGQQGETPGNVMGGLMAAKRRAQDKIKEQEKNE
jgi:hypothetical protein